MPVLKRTKKIATIRSKEPVAAILVSEERSIVQTVEGTISVPNAASQITIPLPRQMKNLNYQIKALWKNTADPFPQLEGFMEIGKTLNDFTLSWNSPLDSANYEIEWQVHEV